ncbi:MAG: hypothetical protein QM724_12435 [Flavobacteriales bacterium]
MTLRFLPDRAAQAAHGTWACSILCLFAGLFAIHAQAQQSDDPSDATTALTYATTNAQLIGTIYNQLPASCSTTGTLNPASGEFTLAGSTPTGTTWAGNPSNPLAQPVCGNYMDLPPSAPNAANDVWFRLDPKPYSGNNSNYSYRFTLFSAGTTNPLQKGGMAVYEAPSAAGPFTLIDCAIGGSNTSDMATLEVNDYTPASTASNPTGRYQLYIRVWDKQARVPPTYPYSTRTFQLCVQGQKVTSMYSRGAGETPSTATAIASTSAASPTVTTIGYVFAKEEPSFLCADSAYVGGDLWVKLTVPASGTVLLYIGRYSTTTQQVNTIGVSAYLASDPLDLSTFRQVGSYTGDLLSLPAYSLPGSFPVSPNLNLSCLPPGETLYVRIHSLQRAQASGYTKRYGALNLYWVAGSTPSSAPANSQPCGATHLDLNVPCPAGFYTNNFGACNTPGIPTPSCSFSGTSNDVWYKFEAPPSGTVNIEVSAGGALPANPAMALYTTGGHSCNGRFTLIQCDDKRGVGNGARIIRTGLVPGQTYYIRAWAEGSGASGTFSVCVSEPVAPAGTCFYLIDLWALNTQGTQFMDVSINSGPIVTYSTSGGDASEQFLVAVPAGASVYFEYYSSNTLGQCITSVTRLGDRARLWSRTVGVAQFGPQPSNPNKFTLTNACQPLLRRSSDCLGARTVCAPASWTQQSSDTIPTGNTYDLTATNMGCLNTEDRGIAWLIFRPIANGKVAFQFENGDLDFAVWDTGPITYMPSMPNVNADYICAPPYPPVRCSSARVNSSTGLQPGLAGITQDGGGGWGWLAPLDVVADHAYLIALVRGGSPGSLTYTMRWTLYNNASGASDPNLMGCTPLVLPVELLFLQAEPRTHAVDLSWATASEHNSSHFVVEHSRDALDFAPISEVSAAGDSQQRVDYFFADAAPAKGINYYRLKQVDRDGSFHYSNVVSAFFGDAPGQPLLIPNPATDEVELLMDVPVSGTIAVLITDALGRVVGNASASAERGTFRSSLNVAQLAPGSYQVHVLAPDGHAIGTARLMKR